MFLNSLWFSLKLLAAKRNLVEKSRYQRTNIKIHTFQRQLISKMISNCAARQHVSVPSYVPLLTSVFCHCTSESILPRFPKSSIKKNINVFRNQIIGNEKINILAFEY